MADESAVRGEPAGWVEEFAFLAELGYRLEREAPGYASWRFGTRSLAVSRDPRDGLLDTHFGDTGLGFGLFQALWVTGNQDLWPSHGWHAWTDDTLRRYVGEVAALLRDHMQGFLVGRPDLWEAAGRMVAVAAEEHTRDVRSLQLRGQAESARVSGDWPLVAKAYESLRDGGFTLTDAENARLRYARGQVPVPEVEWTLTDAWLLTAVGLCGRRGCDLMRLIGTADALNHNVTTELELTRSVGRLIASGLVSCGRGKLRLTRAGRGIHRQRSKDWFEQSGSVLPVLREHPLIEGTWTLEPGEYQEAYDAYSRSTR